MNSYKKLINNSVVFAIGNLGSKMVSFLLVPLYTYFLSTEQYGVVDLVMTTVTMLLPLVSMSMFDALFRFVMSKDKSPDVIMTNSVLIILCGCFLMLMTYPVLSYFNVFGSSLKYMYFILFFQIFEKFLAQYARAIGEIKIYASNGILLTLTTGISNIVLLVYLKLGINGYFFATMLANLISIIFLSLVTKAYKSFSFSLYNRKTVKELLSFSIPMIPNSLMWWLINASSRYFILFFVGVNANGLFAVASKVPALITMITQVFTQAWQISAIEEYEKEDKSLFYTNVFSYLSSILFIGTSALIVVIKMVFRTFFSLEYFDAWTLIPFLLLATVFSSFSGFLGTNYIAAKQTKGVFKTSVYGGFISIILNFLFIPTLGTIGAGISSMISFFIVFLIRYFDTKKYIDVKINWYLLGINLIVIFTQIIVLNLWLPPQVETILVLSLLIILIIKNDYLFKDIIKKINS